MIRSPVKSSNVLSVGYDAEESVLEVEFRGGAVYRYAGVLEDMHRAFLKAGSPGSFLAHNIRGVYPHERVEAKPEPEEE